MRITIEEAIKLLSGGGIVALPTETVYGLAASVAHPEAIAAIFSRKGRPSSNPLIVHVADIGQAEQLVAQWPKMALELMAALWPGPLTLLVLAKEGAVPAAVTAGLPTVALRAPMQEQTRQILRAVGPIVMPSANLSGMPSATTAAHVEADFGADFPVVDGGPSPLGLESTIVAYVEGRWRLARRGALCGAVLERLLPYPLEELACGSGGAAMEEKPLCPGQLLRHYAPQATLLLRQDFSDDSLEGVVLGFSDRRYPARCKVIPLGDSRNPDEVAAALYGALRQLDFDGHAAAFVDIAFPTTGLWTTICERLHRAAKQGI